MRFFQSITLLLFLLAAALVQGQDTLPAIVVGLELDRDEAFVKEQIKVTLRVGVPQNAFGMTQSKLTAGNAELYSLHKSESLENYRNIPYRFVETRYALFGNAEGKIDLSGVTINATLPVSAGSSGSNPSLKAILEPQSIVVRKMPLEDFHDRTEQWLAASQVTIASEWPVFEEALNPGVPLMRHVVIQVAGQHPAAVSEQLNQKLPVGLRAYPASAITSVDKTPDGLEGSVVLPLTLVASKAGEYELPEISLPWWDIDERRWRVATLPAEMLDIVSVDDVGVVANYQRALVVSGLLVAGLCFTCYKLWRRPLRSRQSGLTITSEKSAWQRLKKSVASGSDEEVHQAMMAWAQYHYPLSSVTGFDQFRLRYPRLNELAGRLEQKLFAKEVAVELDRKHLKQVLADTRKQALLESRRPPATNSLYPQSIRSLSGNVGRSEDVKI